MSSKQMNFALLHAVFGVDVNMPVIVNVKNNKAIASRDGVEITTKTVDAALFPTVGRYNVTIVSDEPNKAVVLKTAEQSTIKQSPTFASY